MTEISASDAHYAQLLKDIEDGNARREASKQARENGATKYWYFIYEEYCPVCGGMDVGRERMYQPRPESWEERHQIRDTYDGCEGY